MKRPAKKDTNKKPDPIDDEMSNASTVIGGNSLNTQSIINNEVENDDSSTEEEKRISERLKQFRFSKDIIETDNEVEADTTSQTSQVNDNTVNSDKTSTYSKKSSKQVTLPPFTRYQLMILLDKKK